MDLWKFIDPASNKLFLTQPAPPNKKDFYIQSSSSSITPTTQSTRDTSARRGRSKGSIPRDGTPTATALSTSTPTESTENNATEVPLSRQLDRTALNNEYKLYSQRNAIYKEQRTQAIALQAWVQDTVAEQWLQTACKADTTLREWYKLLKEKVSEDKVESKKSAYKQYKKCLSITKAPNNWLE